mgnify:FL=1
MLFYNNPLELRQDKFAIKHLNVYLKYKKYSKYIDYNKLNSMICQFKKEFLVYHAINLYLTNKSMFVYNVLSLASHHVDNNLTNHISLNMDQLIKFKLDMEIEKACIDELGSKILNRVYYKKCVENNILECLLFYYLGHELGHVLQLRHLNIKDIENVSTVN